MKEWIIEKIYNLKWKKPWQDGHAHFGFHGKDGKQYIINTEFNWVGCVNDQDEIIWTAGPNKVAESKMHINLELSSPNAGCSSTDGTVLIASETNNIIYKIEPDQGIGSVFADCNSLGIGYIGSCEYDKDGNVWVIELIGNRIWKLSPEGKPLLKIGSGTKGFQRGTVRFENAEFGFISCIKCGRDGNLYLVDAGNYAIRMIQPYENTVTTLVGDGQPGYEGDGQDATKARLGKGDYHIQFYEGPWYLAVDDELNIFIADTGNNVIRYVDRKTNLIHTIAGNHIVDRTKRIPSQERDPFRLNMPYLVGVEYYQGRLFVTDWRGDLVILKAKE